MTTSAVSANTQTIQTPSGRIAYAEQGTGPVALFVHGVLLNKHLWRHQLAHLSDIRRCIAVDLLAHGETDIAGDQDVSVTANAKMLEQFLGALNVEQSDLVGNDSGGGIAQIFSALYPQRVRSLTLTDCDLQRFLAAFDNAHTRAIEARLKTLTVPTLIVWGTDDVYFDVEWSKWLAGTIPGTRRRLEFEGARIFFPEERWIDFNKALREHWQ